MTLSARLTTPEDLPALLELFNHTVAIGGTTAHEDIWDLATFRDYYFENPTMVHTVCNGDVPIGFQAVFAVGDGLAIGSFTDQRTPVAGAGAVMLAATRDAARAAGYKWIDAKIRADNKPGLGYYSKMGFVDFKVDKGVPLSDGTPMDRTTKRLML